MSLLLIVHASTGRAEVVKNLYEAQVPVADHSQSALSEAARDALSEVLVKVSGRSSVLENPQIVAGLGRARSYVQQYSYTRDEDAEGELAAHFEFDSAVISQMVTSAGAPLWTVNRPTVLIWIVAQDASGRQFVSRELAPDAMELLQRSFDRRGVPVRFPLYDLQDAAALTLEDAWRLQSLPLVSASQRYGVQEILAGRLTSLSTGEWVGDWSYFSAGDRVDRSISSDSVEGFINTGAALVAEEMSGRYSVSASGADAGGVAMVIKGVNDFSDYAKIIAWLEGLELISHANVERVDGGEITLRLIASADAGQLKTIIELNRRLVPVAPSAALEELSYQWQN